MIMCVGDDDDCDDDDDDDDDDGDDDNDDVNRDTFNFVVKILDIARY